jgi:hypothetical protein
MALETKPFWRRLGQRLWSRTAAMTRTLAEPSEDDILAALLAEPPTFEQRASIRRLCGKVTHVQEIALVQGDPWPTEIRDISSRGVGLVLEHAVTPGTFLLLDLPGPTRIGPPKLRIQVVNLREQMDGSWLHGCVLLRELQSNEVDELIDEMESEVNAQGA